MGQFTTGKPTSTTPRGQAPLGSGIRLRSHRTPQDCAALLEEIFSTYRSPVHKGMPLLSRAGVRWTAQEDKPTACRSGFDRDTHFLLITLGAAADGTTEAGIFPLGSDDGQQRHPVVDHWKVRDSSLTSAGTWPAGSAWLTRPPITDGFIDSMLATAGYPATHSNQLRIADLVFRMMLTKCDEFIQVRQSKAVARRFSEAQLARTDWSSSPVRPLRALMQALAEWDTDFLPYMQDVPPRMRAVALAATTIPRSIWHELDVTN